MSKKGGGSGSVIGFKYYMSIMMGLCRGPIDELIEIKVGDLTAWSGTYDTNSQFSISAPDLFGGTEKEGGIDGPLTLLMGAADQSTGDALVAYAYDIMETSGGLDPPSNSGDDFEVRRTSGGVAGALDTVATGAISYLSALRGTAVCFFDGLICVNNPYPKKWSFRVRRALSGWYNNSAWYPAEARINLEDAVGNPIVAMNPAHIVYECLTNPEWGRGLDPAELDDVSFVSCANTLCREDFGLCIAWARETELSEFIQSIFNHIGGGMYTDRTTGLRVMKLLRKDYEVSDLPLFTYDTGLLRIDDDESSSPDNSHSELIVNWTDPVSNSKRQTRIQNLAGTQASQTVVSTSVDYLGIPVASLAARVAQRDMAAQFPGIKRLTLRFDRRGRKITPLSVFRISAPDRNIEDMVLRAGKIEEGPITDQTIVVTAVQDVFSLESTTYLSEPERAWVAPDRSLAVVADRVVTEVNYRDTVRALTAVELASIAVDSGDVVIIAKAPTPLSTNYELETAATGEDYADQGSFVWTPTALLRYAIDHYETSITLMSDTGMSDITTFPQIAWIGTELVEVTSYDTFTQIAVIGRGCVDTLPVAHAANSRIWFADNFQATDAREYTTGEDVRVKLLTRTNTGVLDISLADEDTWTIIGRQGLPYPPGDFRINSVPFADVTVQVGDVIFTWAERDRITQADHVLVHGDGSTGPEAGVTYTIRIYDGLSNTLLRTTTGITGTTWTYDTTMATADAPGSQLRVELEAVRDGLTSYQHYDWTFRRVLVGWGLGWGLRWGLA